MIELTPFQEQTLVLVVAVVGTMAGGLLVHSWLVDRRDKHGWTQAANALGRRIGAERRGREQLESHVAHLAAEQERMKAQLAQIAARPPSDPTVRLGIAPRTARMSRLDPWPTSDQSPEAMAWREANGSAS